MQKYVIERCFVSETKTGLSKIDVQILTLIQQDASLTTQQIADQINISQSPCWRRISRLQEKGLITRRVSQLAREKPGIDVVGFATINLSVQRRNSDAEFEEEGSLLQEVSECYPSAGRWDCGLHIDIRNISNGETL